MKKCFYFAVMFLRAFMAGATIVKLVPTNPNYPASWESFAAFIVLSIMFGAFLTKEGE